MTQSIFAKYTETTIHVKVYFRSIPNVIEVIFMENITKVSVRLGRETKDLIDDLILDGQRNLKERINDGFLLKLEDTVLQKHRGELIGISLNINLKITTSSVIQEAYVSTKQYSDVKWDQLASSLKNFEVQRSMRKQEVNPKLPFTHEVLNGLRNYQTKFMELPTFKDAKRALNFGYVIKLVIYAYWYSKQ